MDRGPRIGVTDPFSLSDLDICLGVGPRLGWAWFSDRGLIDWLVKPLMNVFIHFTLSAVN